eukprot:2053648-Prymnesium_polylepis.3
MDALELLFAGVSSRARSGSIAATVRADDAARRLQPACDVCCRFRLLQRTRLCVQCLRRERVRCRHVAHPGGAYPCVREAGAGTSHGRSLWKPAGRIRMKLCE